MADSYYYSIWTTLSKAEKFILYDLAIDGFVNVKNEKAIRALMQKGLIVYKDNLKVMNESFNNFVLTVVNRDMDRAMRREIEKHGTWNILQIALLMVIMGASLFVLHEQNHLMDSFDFIVTAVIAFGTFLLRFSSMWGALGGSSNSVK